MAELILLTAEPENWVPQQLEAKAKAKQLDVEIINPDAAYISLTDDPFISHDGIRFKGAKFCIPRLSETNLEYKTAIIDHLEKMGIIVLNTGSALRTASNKVETQILLNNAGLKTPKTAVFTCEEQLEKAIESIGNTFPIIIKTIYGTHGIGVIRVDSLASARSVIQQLIKSGEQFMIQEYIEHVESARILLLNENVLASVMRTIPEGDFRSNAHQGAELKIHEASQHEIETAIRAAQTLNINFAAVDYILLENGDIIILEVNGSPGFESMQKVVTDVDIAEKIIDECINMMGSVSDNSIAPIDTVTSEVDPLTVDVESIEDPIQPSVEDEILNPPSDEVEVPNHDVDTDSIIGTITHVKIKHFNDEQPIEARVDTGANISSIHGTNIVLGDNTIKFDFNNVTYKFHLLKMTKIKQSDSENGAVARPVIRVDMEINDVLLRNVEVTVTERDHMKYEVLLGRQTLAAAGVLVNPALGMVDNSNSTNSEEE